MPQHPHRVLAGLPDQPVALEFAEQLPGFVRELAHTRFFGLPVSGDLFNHQLAVPAHDDDDTPGAPADPALAGADGGQPGGCDPPPRYSSAARRTTGARL